MQKETPRKMVFNLNNEAAYEKGLICGGTVEIFVEPILPQPIIYLFGGGHVSMAMAKAASSAGFAIGVVDDREAFANLQRFPMAQEIFTSYEQAFEKIQPNASTYLVIVTRGHKEDMRLRAHGPCEHAHIFFVSAGDDDEIRRRIGLNFLEGLLVAGENLLRHRKALQIGEGFAIVDNSDGKARGTCRFGHGHGDVTAAEEIDDGLRENRLDENFHPSPAEQAVVIGGLVVEIKNNCARRFFLHHFFTGRPDVGFDPAATHGADQRTIFAD